MDTVNLDSSNDNEKLWTMLTFAEEEGLFSVVLPVVCKLSDNSFIVMGGTSIEDGSQEPIADSCILKLGEGNAVEVIDVPEDDLIPMGFMR